VDGDSLEAALRDYGPAAIEDLLPRLRTIADTLDAAHATGQVHGGLHPQNIFVSAERTQVTGLGAGTEWPIRRPYSAPEVAAGSPADAASDQFALAAVTFEWLFGRRVSGPAVRPVEVRALPGVDRDALAKAFTRALAPEAAHRYPSCTAFSNALAAAVIPMLPLGNVDEDVVEAAVLPEPPVAVAEPAEVVIEPSYVTSEPRRSSPVEPVRSWRPSASYAPAKAAERFSGGMLIVSCLVGMVVGFAAGYMARPRALQSGPVHTMAVLSNGTDGAVVAVPPPMPGIRAAGTPPATPSTGLATATGTGPAAQTAASRSEKPVATASGVLVVDSRPPGASVVINGTAKGRTPLAVEALAPGSYRVTLSLAGYQPFATTVRVVAGERTRAAASLSVQE